MLTTHRSSGFDVEAPSYVPLSSLHYLALPARPKSSISNISSGGSDFSYDGGVRLPPPSVASHRTSPRGIGVEESTQSVRVEQASQPGAQSSQNHGCPSAPNHHAAPTHQAAPTGHHMTIDEHTSEGFTRNDTRKFKKINKHGHRASVVVDPFIDPQLTQDRMTAALPELVPPPLFAHRYQKAKYQYYQGHKCNLKCNRKCNTRKARGAAGNHAARPTRAMGTTCRFCRTIYLCLSKHPSFILLALP
jgi:hypothetical protein